MDIGPREIVVLAVVILVLFGSKRIPDVAKSIVESVRNLRGAFKDDASSAITKR
jgi:TatA/E family protein of Tat protein translocase